METKVELFCGEDWNDFISAIGIRKTGIKHIMNFDPQKFFSGLMAFFSIMLPGALFAYLLKDEMAHSE